MTKNELKQKMIEFINSRDSQRDEFWTSERSLARWFLTDFAKEMGIEIDETDTRYDYEQ